MAHRLTQARRMIQAAGRRVGITITRAPAPGTLPHHLRHLLRRLGVTCVVDVGANEGQFARLLRDEVRFDGRIASVEPSSRAFALLSETMARDPLWQGFNFALGDQSGSATLTIVESDDFTSFHPLNRYARERFRQLDVVAQEEVRVHRLSEVFEEVAAGHEHVFVKCDTQGHDMAVIAGLGDRAVTGLQLELSLVALYDDVPHWLDAVEHLAALGYQASGFFPVSRDHDGLVLLEMDGVFVRR